MLLRRILDSVFKRKLLSLTLPLITSAAVLVLVLLSAKPENDIFILTCASVAICAVWYFALYGLLVGISRIKSCPEWYLDSLMLMLLAATGASALYQLVGYFVDTSKPLSFAVCMCISAWSAVSLAHNKRK